MLDECPAEALEIKENDIYARQLEELDRKADRLIDAFAEKWAGREVIFAPCPRR